MKFTIFGQKIIILVKTLLILLSIFRYKSFSTQLSIFGYKCQFVKKFWILDLKNCQFSVKIAKFRLKSCKLSLQKLSKIVKNCQFFVKKLLIFLFMVNLWFIYCQFSVHKFSIFGDNFWWQFSLTKLSFEIKSYQFLLRVTCLKWTIYG